ncbi:MAG: acyl-CoA/acyl-ACP dehydrogenase [Sphingobium sp.]|nr:acyl-CoA/acyl-ACP dehydrogenase [Sphingobium sp.]MCI1270771.1 acyl-CoA/acyl-ACP dehydrogenase [Sphingobium sp.]MCI1756383.1 acyl-CoA/acyl-ACP dehydrogenase [Sphingobium sp.]MCI2051922.1 acyl-CoA/acyl-ACP dehydrogenase [Sphingobium sp.]
MDETLVMLRDTAAAFVRARPDHARQFRDANRATDPQAWRQIAEQGWLAIMVPEAAGGLGLGVTPAALVAEELGRGAFPDPYVAVGILAVQALLGAEDPDLWQDRLAAIAQGELLAAVAWQNSAVGSSWDMPGIRGREVDGQTVLEGESRFVVPSAADAFIVSVQEGEGISLYWLDRATAGLTLRMELAADGTSYAWMIVDNVIVDPARRIATGAAAREALDRAINAALVVTSAELVGAMSQALVMTLEYLRTRKQFGVAIGSFQALQHKAVDLWIQWRLAEAAVGAAARVLDDPAASLARQSAVASGAKARAAQAAHLICSQAIQLHGAIGYADEYGLGLFLNRTLALSAWLGNASAHRRRYSQLTRGDHDSTEIAA